MALKKEVVLLVGFLSKKKGIEKNEKEKNAFVMAAVLVEFVTIIFLGH